MLEIKKFSSGNWTYNKKALTSSLLAGYSRLSFPVTKRKMPALCLSLEMLYHSNSVDNFFV